MGKRTPLILTLLVAAVAAVPFVVAKGGGQHRRFVPYPEGSHRCPRFTRAKDDVARYGGTLDRRDGPWLVTGDSLHVAIIGEGFLLQEDNHDRFDAVVAYEPASR